MKSKWFLIVATVLVIGLLFSFSLIGCKTTTAAEATEVEVTAAEATEAEATSAEVVAGAAEEKIGTGMTIYAQCGGKQGEPSTDPMVKGVKDAAAFYGAEVVLQFAEWTADKMIAQMKEAVAAKPDGIIVIGIPGEEALRPLVEEAFNLGIVVNSGRVDVPGIEKDYISKGFGYTGLNLYETGRGHAAKVIELGGLKKGDRVLVFGVKASSPTLAPLVLGMEDQSKESGMVVDFIEVTDQMGADPASAVPVIAGYFSSNPDCKAIMCWHGVMTSVAKQLLEGAGLKADDVFFAGADPSVQNLAILKEGWLDLIGDQQIYLQGFLPAQQIILTKAYGFSGLHTPTGNSWISKDTDLNILTPLMEQSIR